MSVALTKVRTKTCGVCGERGIVEVPKQGYHDWTFGGALIQVAMPDVPAPIREQLISGYHPECWEDYFYHLNDFDV